MKTNSKTAGSLLLTACTISFVCFFGSYMRIPIVPLFATSLAGMGPLIREHSFRAGYFLSGAAGLSVMLLFRFLYRRQAVIDR